MIFGGQGEIQQAAEYSGWRIVQSSGLHLRLEAKDFFCEHYLVASNLKPPTPSSSLAPCAFGP